MAVRMSAAAMIVGMYQSQSGPFHKRRLLALFTSLPCWTNEQQVRSLRGPALFCYSKISMTTIKPSKIS